jgi:hypothetical protein
MEIESSQSGAIAANKVVAITFFCLMSAVYSRAQTVSINDKLKEVTNIEIHFFKATHGDSAIYRTRKRIDLLFLKELITKAKNKPGLQSDTTGEIIYFERQNAII